MARLPKLRKKNGYWMTKAGGTETYFGKVVRLAYADHAIRLKANPVLERKIAHLLKRPVGRPSHRPKKFYASLRYRAGSWDQARRVVAKVECHAGELFPRVGFIVTNLKWSTSRVVRFYNRRGTAAVDQGGQECREVDQAIVPAFQG